MKNHDSFGLPFVFLMGDTREFFASYRPLETDVHEVPIGRSIGDDPGSFTIGVDGPSGIRRCISFVQKDGKTHYFVLFGQGLALKLACVDDYPCGALRVLVSVDMAEHLRADKGGFFVLWSNGTDLVVDLESFGAATFQDGIVYAKPFASPDETADMGYTGPRQGIVETNDETADMGYTKPRGG